MAAETRLWSEIPGVYQPIVDRNVFGIKPPPPPPTNTAPVTPPPPQAKVTLTGLTSLFGPPKALMEIVEQEPGKPPSSRKPILREGERDGSVEVISIDVVKNIVRIRNGTLETNLTFETKSSTPSPTAAAAPGGPPQLSGRFNPVPALTPTPAVASATASTPNIISKSPRDTERTGINLYGGAATPTTTAATPMGGAVSYAGGYGYANPGLTAASLRANTGTDGGLSLNMPSRTVRTDVVDPSVAAGAQTGIKADPVTQYITMRATEEAHRQKGFDFPPTPPLPGVSAADDPGAAKVIPVLPPMPK